MRITPLHEALGLDRGDFTFDLVRQACDLQIAEGDNLDWKRALPLPASTKNDAEAEARQQELAKDIAAMGNTRGRLIVYGVEEGPPTRANAIRSVGPINPDTNPNIRRIANNLIYPPVSGLNFTALESDDGKESLLALFVPAKP